MFLGMLMMFSLFAGLALIFGANFMQNRDKLRALLMIVGTFMSIVPLAVILISFFYPIWE